MFRMSKLSYIAVVLFLCTSIAAQSEALTNRMVIEMTAVGLSTEVIRAKILESEPRFDTSVAALIELKKAGVADEIITLIVERTQTVPPSVSDISQFSDSDTPASDQPSVERVPVSPQEAIRNARTIAFKKSSAQPSRQNLEKALLKNPDFKRSGLTILRIKEEADLFVEIGFVSGSWLTHRYVYRIYDRRSGVVLAAGETTSWGSLAENLAKHISRSLMQIEGKH